MTSSIMAEKFITSRRSRPKGLRGNYRQQVGRDDLPHIGVSDFNNPFNFFNLLALPLPIFLQWLMSNGLLASRKRCDACDEECTLIKRSASIDGQLWRCPKSKNHTFSVRQHSFFSKSKLTVFDVMLFIRNFIDSMSLSKNAKQCGIAYQSTAVDWASFCRELCKEFVHKYLPTLRLQNEVEIDESMFGHKFKHNRGAQRGVKVWILGIVERHTGRLVLYPVEDRSQQTLEEVIERHVVKGSTIYTDGWSSYANLNNLGYDHFTVCHKYTFKAVYEHVSTKEKREVHTNQIEGAWKHAKEHFKRMSGTNIKQFESHLAEIIWRNSVDGDHYAAYFDLLKSIYPLNKPAVYTYPTPLFDTWNMQADENLNNTTIVPVVDEMSTPLAQVC